MKLFIYLLMSSIQITSILHASFLPEKTPDTTQIHFASGISEETEEFLTMQGWYREPLANYLQIPDLIMWQLYNPIVSALSSAAYYDATPIGCRDVYWFKQDYLDVFPANKAKALALYPNENSLHFMNILQASYDYESTILVQKCQDLNIPLEKIVKNVGLMILKNFAGYGIATKLQAESINHLRSLGIQAIVCNTTNSISARVMEKNGFILQHQFSYEADFGLIGMPGYWNIWLLVL